jgi:hypothetical protein
MAAAWAAWAAWAATSNPPARTSGYSDGLRGIPPPGAVLCLRFSIAATWPPRSISLQGDAVGSVSQQLGRVQPPEVRSAISSVFQMTAVAFSIRLYRLAAVVRSRTAANGDSIGFVSGMKAEGGISGDIHVLPRGRDAILGPMRDASSRAGACAMVREPGQGRWGARRMGRPLTYHEPRVRVSIWPPLRLARMRCERGSVGVV